MTGQRKKYYDFLPIFGRFFISLIFIVNGLHKAMEFDPSLLLLQNKGFPIPEFFLVCTIAIEAAGGIMLAMGYKTKAVAAIMAVYLIMATFVYHPIWADMNNYLDFAKNLAIIGALITLVYHGAGPKSVDNYHKD